MSKTINYRVSGFIKDKVFFTASLLYLIYEEDKFSNCSATLVLNMTFYTCLSQALENASQGKKVCLFDNTLGSKQLYLK